MYHGMFCRTIKQASALRSTHRVWKSKPHFKPIRCTALLPACCITLHAARSRLTSTPRSSPQFLKAPCVMIMPGVCVLGGVDPTTLKGCKANERSDMASLGGGGAEELMLLNLTITPDVGLALTAPGRAFHTAGARMVLRAR